MANDSSGSVNRRGRYDVPRAGHCAGTRPQPVGEGRAGVDRAGEPDVLSRADARRWATHQDVQDGHRGGTVDPGAAASL